MELQQGCTKMMQMGGSCDVSIRVLKAAAYDVRLCSALGPNGQGRPGGFYKAVWTGTLICRSNVHETSIARFEYVQEKVDSCHCKSGRFCGIFEGGWWEKITINVGGQQPPTTLSHL